MEEGQIFNLIIPAKSFYQISMGPKEDKKTLWGEDDYISLMALYQKNQLLGYNTLFK